MSAGGAQYIVYDLPPQRPVVGVPKRAVKLLNEHLHEQASHAVPRRVRDQAPQVDAPCKYVRCLFVLIFVHSLFGFGLLVA